MLFKDLEITEYNYEGYLELFQFQLGNVKLSEKYQKCELNSLCLYEIGLLVYQRKFGKMHQSKKEQKDTYKETLSLIFDDFYERLEKQKKQKKLLFLKLQMLEMRYPYIDIDFSFSDIERALLNVNLLQKNKNDEYRLNYKEFFRYLELKEKINNIPLFESYKYQIISCNKEVPYVKIKTKKRGK